MLISPPDAASWSAQQRRSGRRIGFVPTMGALHEGHLALVAAAREQCDAVAASIFVNPLQFNNPEDLARYPRQLDQDLPLLEAAGCDLVFTPEAQGIYADFTPRRYELGALDTVLEGASRPGHFQGMINVVERLFHYVRPDRAFFGEKDRQQLAVVRHVAAQQRWPVTVIGRPTLRAPDGLALSSRNQRLSPAERTRATVLHKALQAVAGQAFRAPVDEAREAGLRALAEEPAVQLDYLSIAHPDTLQPLRDWDGLDEAVALIAAQVGPVRLIDNITLRR
ncbi:MAG: pantoate--beta-alanine ligase [Bacteroidetes bacterium]|nr:pantoate--beta-alanine ligase [Bacteroidota bacterium]